MYASYMYVLFLQFQKRRSVLTQYPPEKPQYVEKGTQTKIKMEILGASHVNDSLNTSVFSVGSTNDPNDPDWEPEEEENYDDSECEIETTKDINEMNENKFIVYESCLNELLGQCSLCGSKTCVTKKTIGSMLLCDIKCVTCNSISCWRSQPMSGNMPLGNLVISAGILFSGSSPVKHLRALNFANIVAISISTYNSIQTAYLTPTVLSVWRKQQEEMVTAIQNEDRPLRLAGDMRCCTPGHTAKYGSYSLLDLEAGKVLDTRPGVNYFEM